MDDDIVMDFVAECTERLDRLDRDLVELEQRPRAHDLVASAFRALHTIKGTSGLLGFRRLETLTHAGENLLSRVREGHLAVTPATTDALLRVSDVARELLVRVEAGGSDDGVPIEPVLDGVSALLAAPAAPAYDVTGGAGLPDGRDAGPATVRVELAVLESLTGLVAELGLARDQILTGARGAAAGSELVRAAQRLDLVTSRLEHGVLSTTRLPVGQLWSRLPRVVRDLGAQCGKQVSLTTVGYETELDRGVLDALKAPLTHLLRNAVDHGIECPETRAAAGKQTAGTLVLRATQAAGEVVIEVADDGAGIDVDQVAAHALVHGVRTAPQLATMTRPEVLQLILLPGFSTTTCATRLSGRGVGLDVVRSDVESIGGRVEIESAPGAGTTCRLRLPLGLSLPLAG